MSKNSQIITGMILLIGLAAGLFLWFRTTIPSNEEVNSKVVKIEAIDANILQSLTAQQVMKMETNGDLPVTVKSEDVGKSNPFQ